MLYIDIISQKEGQINMLDFTLYLQKISQRIMEHRKKFGLTQEALAQKTGQQHSLFPIQNRIWQKGNETRKFNED